VSRRRARGGGHGDAGRSISLPVIARRQVCDARTSAGVARKRAPCRNEQGAPDHLEATFFAEYQALRDQLMSILTDEDLARDLGGGSRTLASLCREIGDIEFAYVESFRTFRTDFGYRNADPALERSVPALVTWYAELDRDLTAALDALSEEDVLTRRIVRGDFDEDFFSPLPRVQLDIYREALLIFYAKVSVYLRAMDRALPGIWSDWIG
jgi:hypothetical protein